MKYDIIVIGAGSGGLTAAIGLAAAGKSVALIEGDKMGGECTNTGCIPSKALIHAAKKYKQGSLDSPLKALEYTRKTVAKVRTHESPEQMKNKGVKLFQGFARFQDPHTIIIKKKDRRSQKITGKKIIIATGSSPYLPKIEGLDKDKILTNQNIFDLKSVPKNFAILGGGPIGCEMAQAFANLGSKVTIITNSNLLPREHKEISQQVEKDMKAQGITIVKSTIEMTDTNNITCKNKKVIPYDKILMAIGRKPNTEGLNLDAAHITYSEKGIETNDNLQTSQKHIFAVGDVRNGAKFTHLADDQSRFVIKKILLPFVARKEDPLPAVTFLEKEVATIGDINTKTQDDRIVKLPYESTDRSITDQYQKGLIIVRAKRLTGKIKAVTIIGENAGEVLGGFTIAMKAKMSLWKCSSTMMAYPTHMQIIKKTGDTFAKETIKDIRKELSYTGKKMLPKIGATIFWIAIALTYYQYKTRGGYTDLDVAKQINDFLQTSPSAILAYIAIYALRPLILFPATFLTLMSGIVFGFWWGSLFTIIGANLSANFAYWIGRLLGKDAMPQEGQGIIARWKRKLKQESFITIIIMRLLYLPFDLVNYTSGILGVKWIPYTAATLIGSLPGTITFVSFGASIENLESFDPGQFQIDVLQVGVSVLLLAASLLITKIIKKHQ